jgi:LmbE family N-acetylglucosaminyl deacetylase
MTVQEIDMRREITIVAALGGVVAVAVIVLADRPALAQANSRTLLAVFAHPDDEQVVSPMLARYAREGVRVHLAIATDGRKGVREHAGIPAGDALATARAAEARCACEKLKIEAPTLMGVADGELYQDTNKKTVLEGVARLLTDLKPDAVVTWGPDGVTGHTDHRMVSNLVTEVIQRSGAGSPRLYYSGFSSMRAAALSKQDAPTGGGIPPEIAVVDDRYLPVRIAYQEQDAGAAADALACHKTQYTTEEVAGMLRMTRSLEDGAVRLRPWFGDSGSATDVFK